MKGWIKVYSSNEEYQAVIINSLLSQNGLKTVILDQKDDGFRLGFSDVYASSVEAEKAFKIIQANSNNETGLK